MIHNGIEYGMMQAIAEGFDILKHANSPRLPEELRLAIDVADVAEVWRRGSVITSWLLDLTAAALAEDPQLAGYSGHVEDSGEGRWTVQAAIEEAVPAEVLTSALYTRFRSRQDHTFAEKVLSAMRKGFGGHVEPGKSMSDGDTGRMRHRADGRVGLRQEHRRHASWRGCSAGRSAMPTASIRRPTSRRCASRIPLDRRRSLAVARCHRRLDRRAAGQAASRASSRARR